MLPGMAGQPSLRANAGRVLLPEFHPSAISSPFWVRKWRRGSLDCGLCVVGDGCSGVSWRVALVPEVFEIIDCRRAPVPDLELLIH